MIPRPTLSVLLAAISLLAFPLHPAAFAQSCPTGCTPSGTGTDLSTTSAWPNWIVQRVSGTYSALPASCTQGEYANVVNTTLPQIAPFWCATTNTWQEFPLLDAAANGNLPVPGNLNVGPTSSTGAVKLFSAGGGWEILTVPATLGASQTGAITVPAGSANMLTDSLQATVTNKSLSDSTVAFVNSSDSTKQLAVNLSGAAPGTAATLALVQQSPITITGPTVSSTLGGVVYASNSTGDIVTDSTAAGITQAFLQR